MNRFLGRILPLVLAVLFLTSAGGVSFYLLFSGVRAAAAETVTAKITDVSTGKLTENEQLSFTLQITDKNMTKAEYDAFTGTDAKKIRFSNNAVFETNSSGSFDNTAKSETEGCSYSVTISGIAFHKTDTTKASGTLSFTKADGSKIERSFSLDFSAWLTGDTPAQPSNDYSLQSYVFYDLNGEPLSQLRNGTPISKLVLTIRDSGLDINKYNAAVDAGSRFSATLNYSTFAKDDKGQPIFSKATLLDSGLVSYQVTFNNLRYTGKTTQLEVKIGYPQEFGLERRQFTETLPEGELYVPDNRGDDDDTESSSSSRPDIAPPTPSIIVSAYDYGGGSPTAASKVDLKITFTNTSAKLAIDNIVMKVTMPEAFTLTNSSNIFYIDRMTKGASETRSLGFTVKPSAEAISHPIKVSFTFEAIIKEERKSFTSDMEISIPVTQLNRVTLNPVEVPSELYIMEGMGGENSVEATFVNKGKATIYNVTLTIAGENLKQPGQPQFIGNLESGKEGSADFIIDPLAAGPLTGEIIMSYEDANMQVSELRTPFATQAIAQEMEPSEPDPSEMLPEADPVAATPWIQTVPVIYWVVGGAVLLVVLAFIVRVIYTAKGKKLEAENEDF